MSCEDKVRYHSAEKAGNALKKARERGSRNKHRKMPTRSYHCNQCGGYHLTSMPFIQRRGAHL